MLASAAIKRHRPVNSLHLIRSERIERANFLNRKETKKLDFLLRQLERENRHLATSTHRKKKRMTLQLLQLYRSTGHSTEAIPLQQGENYKSDSVLSTKRFDEWRRQERELTAFLSRSKLPRPSDSFYKVEDKDDKGVPCVLNLKASDYDFAIPDWFEEKCVKPPTKQVDVFSSLRNEEVVKRLDHNLSENGITTFPGNQWNKSVIEEYKRRVKAANSCHIHQLHLEDNKQTKPLSAADILKARQESKLTNVTNSKSTDGKHQRNSSKKSVNSSLRIPRIKTGKPSTRSSNKRTGKRAKTAPALRIKQRAVSENSVSLQSVDSNKNDLQEVSRMPSAHCDLVRHRSNVSTISVTKLETTKEKELLQFLMTSFRQATAPLHPPEFPQSKDSNTSVNKNLIRTESSGVTKLMLNSLQGATVQTHVPKIHLSRDPTEKVTERITEKPDASQLLRKSMDYYRRCRSAQSSISGESANENETPSPMLLDVDKSDISTASEISADTNECGDEDPEFNLTSKSLQCNQSPHLSAAQQNCLSNVSETSGIKEDGKTKKEESVLLPKPFDDASASLYQSDSQVSNSSQHVSDKKQSGKRASDLNRRNNPKSSESPEKNYHVTSQQQRDVSPSSAHSRREGAANLVAMKQRKKCATQLPSHQPPTLARDNVSESALSQKAGKIHDSSEMIKSFSHATSLHVRRNFKLAPRGFSQTKLPQSQHVRQLGAISEFCLRENDADDCVSGTQSSCTNPYPVTPKRVDKFKPRDRAFMGTMICSRHHHSERDFLNSKNKMAQWQKDLANEAPLDGLMTSISNIRNRGVQSSLLRQKRLESLVAANKDSHERLLDEVRTRTNIKLSAVMTFAKLQSSNLFKRQSVGRPQNCLVKLDDGK